MSYPWDNWYDQEVLSANELKAAFNYNVNPSSLHVGATGWLEALIPATEVLSDFISLSTRGGPGAAFATRTSDAGPTSAGAMGAWAFGAFAINDNATQVQTAYGGYVETRRYANAGVTEGIEIAMINRGDVKQGSPHFWAQDGCTIGLLLGSGRSDVTPNQNNTTAMVVAGGESPNAKWQTGIIFGEHSIAVNGGYPDAPVAIDLPQGYSFLWRDAADQPGAYIRSDVTTSPNYHGAGGIVFTNDGMQFNSAFGGCSVALSSAGMFVNGTFVAQNNVSFGANLSVTGTISVGGQMAMNATGSFSNDATAAASGVPLRGVYIDSSTKSLRVRVA